MGERYLRARNRNTINVVMVSIGEYLKDDQRVDSAFCTKEPFAEVIVDTSILLNKPLAAVSTYEMSSTGTDVGISMYCQRFRRAQSMKEKHDGGRPICME